MRVSQPRGSESARQTRYVPRHDPGRGARELEDRKEDPGAVMEIGVGYATLQCSDLLAGGAPGVHFYTLNESPPTRAALASLRAAHPWDRVPSRSEAGA